ncbi:MerC domain-containing protein [Flavobacterium gawalongense]|uniref:MerC domain-containing protein n=1 Tax=Flavobacterium gawalongense TaxID=2594432 RepID=A0A553BX44_9FLAO|nr:MerC domain-containing protein [Flavobacterium gawalongense]TRX09290.1 MerC domain-containing protein [Flavobacterium gawalongense]TRX12897.1 MerC domain-containing protein [Flavobacterium gawalongense]TRX13241.1 MerC domain-containing protein [Flavobacterium gawalongense]TRX30697.1 MerC domain-containing protein [Flavobacterium gawalongense]
MKIINNMDKLGTVGLFTTALFSPCCFPLFAFGASTFGLGSFELFGGWTMWIFLFMVLISIIGLIISYQKHRNVFPLLIAIPSVVLIYYEYYFNSNTYFIYIGMFGLLLATGINYYRNKLYGTCDTCVIYNGNSVELKSTLTCPNCGCKKDERMPADACQFFYECENCKTVLKPKQGDCCVYCSYGTVKCPPIQAGDKCC